MSLTDLVLFSVSKNIDISKISILGGGGGGGGGQIITSLTLETGPLTVFFTKNDIGVLI